MTTIEIKYLFCDIAKYNIFYTNYLKLQETLAQKLDFGNFFGKIS